MQKTGKRKYEKLRKLTGKFELKGFDFQKLSTAHFLLKAQKNESKGEKSILFSSSGNLQCNKIWG